MTQDNSKLKSDNDIHLRDYLRVLNKRRVLVLAVFSLIFTVVVLKTYSATPLYQGTTKVLIEKSANETLSRNMGYRFFDPEFYETQFQLIKGRGVAMRVVESLDLLNNPGMGRGISGEKDGLLTSVGSWFSDLKALVKGLFAKTQPVGEEVVADRLVEVADGLKGGITVHQFEDSRIVTISYTSANPKFAARVANATATAYIQETLEMKHDSTRLTLDWMTRKATEEGSKLEEAEQRLQEYMVANDIVSMESRMSVTPEQLSQISSQLVKAESKRKQLEVLYRKVQRAAKVVKQAMTIPAVASDPVLQTLRAQILRGEQEIIELSGKYGKKHPKMHHH